MRSLPGEKTEKTEQTEGGEFPPPPSGRETDEKPAEAGLDRSSD